MSAPQVSERQNAMHSQPTANHDGYVRLQMYSSLFLFNVREKCGKSDQSALSLLLKTWM